MRYLLVAVLAVWLWSAGSAAGQPPAVAPVVDASVHAKLDQILANQERVFARLDAIDAELAVIKVRATRK